MEELDFLYHKVIVPISRYCSIVPFTTAITRLNSVKRRVVAIRSECLLRLMTANGEFTNHSHVKVDVIHKKKFFLLFCPFNYFMLNAAGIYNTLNLELGAVPKKFV